MPGCDLLFGSDETRGSGVAEILWTAPKQDRYESLVRPVIEEGRTYVTYDDHLVAFEVETGEEIWRRALTDDPNRSGVDGRKILHDGGPDGTLYLNDVNWIGAFRKRDGAPRWTRNYTEMTPSGLNTMAQDEAHLYLGGRGSAIQVAKANGRLVRQFPLDAYAPSGVVENTDDIDIAGGLLVVPTGFIDAADTHTLGAVYAFDTATGALLWSEPTPERRYFFEGLQDTVWADTDASGAVVAGDLVAVTTNSQVLGLDRATGALVWEWFRPEESGFWVGPTVANGAVYAGGTTERVHKLDLATGETVWTHRMKGSLQPIITVDEGRVYFTNNGWGELWVLDDATGRPVWHGQPPAHERTGEIYFSPVAVGEDHLVVVGDQFVYGLSKP
ncbi:MAG: PQQ-binding-like beta-propeller repeat protein [Bacteroidota bacterium]